MPKVYVTGEGLEARAKVAFDLNRLEVKIGRADDNDLVINDDSSISSYHCSVLRVFGGYVVKDLGSSNGIYENGERSEKFLLQNAMEFHVGDSQLVFAYSKEELEQLQQEEQNPRVYMTNADLIAGTATQQEPVVAQAVQEPAPGAAAVQKPKPLSASPSSQTYRPRKTYVQPSGPNPVLVFLGVIIMFVLGMGGGFYLKHKQMYESDFFKDLGEKKIKTVLE